MEKYYLTTAIDYVNGAPHIGHAYEKILSDIITRHYTQRCDDVYMLTGTDEHGIKIQKTAASKGITPKELCDENSQKFKDAWNYFSSACIWNIDPGGIRIYQRTGKSRGFLLRGKFEKCNGCE